MMQRTPAKRNVSKTSAAEAELLPVREQQRQQRRKLLIDAAREVFYETHYILAKVEDILERADISRPTFYRYFSDEEAVLREIMLEDVTAQSKLWEEIATLGKPSEKQISTWALRYLKGMRR